MYLISSRYGLEAVVAFACGLHFAAIKIPETDSGLIRDTQLVGRAGGDRKDATSDKEERKNEGSITASTNSAEALD